MKTGFSLLAAILFFASIAAPRGSACQYCEMAADPSQQVVFPTPDSPPGPVADTAAGGAVPTALPLLAAPTLTAVSHVTTRFSDLPATASRAAKLAALRLPTTVLSSNPPPTVQPIIDKPPVNTSSNPRPPAIRWADLGLLGIAASGGIFYWRTRRLG